MRLGRRTKGRSASLIGPDAIEACIEGSRTENRKKSDEELLLAGTINWLESTILFNLSNRIVAGADNRTGGRLKCLTKRGTGVRPAANLTRNTNTRQGLAPVRRGTKKGW